MANPTPKPTDNPYAATVVKPTVVPSTGGAAIPATVSTATGSSVIAASQQRAAAQNAVVNSGSGMKVSGGSKRSDHKRRSKRSDHKRRSKRSDHKRRSRRSRRSRRGGNPTPTPSAKPTVPVPQFQQAGASANASILGSNHVAMKAGAQAAFDNPNAPPSNHKVV